MNELYGVDYHFKTNEPLSFAAQGAVGGTDAHNAAVETLQPPILQANGRNSHAISHHSSDTRNATLGQSSPSVGSLEDQK